MRNLLLTIALFTVFSGYSQTDNYSSQALKFSKEIVECADSLEIIKLLNDSLITESGFREIKFIQNLLNDNKDRIQYYVVKIHVPIPLYNINLHDPETLEQFGDFRVLFTNENDFLIDKWKYIPESESKKNEEQLKLPMNIPVPPPPPKNK